MIVGQYLLENSSLLAKEFEMVGDVRGTGLFIGIELVKSKECREPATAEANEIVDRMKNVHHILISSDGPDDNVLKLKPPMVFNIDNAREFLTAIRECLGQYQSNVEVKMNVYRKILLFFSLNDFSFTILCRRNWWQFNKLMVAAIYNQITDLLRRRKF